MQITIAGHRFSIPDAAVARFDQYFTPDAPDGLRHTVKQTLAENLRNNFASKVKGALNGSEELAPEQVTTLQGDFDAYSMKYEFGVRQPGSGRTVVDPVEREMLKLAKDDFQKAFFAKYGEKATKEQTVEYAEKLIEAKADAYRKRANAILRQRESAGDADLAALGLA